MYKQKKSNSELEYSLDLLKRKREDLVSLFIEQDVELLRKTFEYEKSPAAFSLVRSQFITQRINEHFEQITDDDISDENSIITVTVFLTLLRLLCKRPLM